MVIVLLLVQSEDPSADVVKLQEQIKQAEVRIQHLSTERDALAERLKVRSAANICMRFIWNGCRNV